LIIWYYDAVTEKSKKKVKLNKKTEVEIIKVVVNIESFAVKFYGKFYPRVCLLALHLNKQVLVYRIQKGFSVEL
jgi:hypothetical protein